MGLCTETLERVSPPVHISNLSYCHTTPLEVCARGGADFNGQFFFMRRYVSKLTFGNYLNYVAMCPTRVGHGPDAPNEWRKRVVRVGEARGGPCGQVHIARRPPWRWLRLTVWATAGRSNQIARNGQKRAAGALQGGKS